ncbi:hypothetical protein BS47DRAFT_1374301 [Hydnum rufescens UP504]|uniref:Amino acid transporter n=1 Tax=Hydnum rufescens UP504 TaxID=1448309 RepID=A0A9P6AGX1_9AGAM|nr:hypothetical protein BS47DRAFT_1374301 [Hydnum rufescens UP504]
MTPVSGAAGLTGNDAPERLDRKKVIFLSPDEEILAGLGYKQEFKRAFSPFELFAVSFSIIGVFPSIASVLIYAVPNGGPSAMVWGWFVASLFLVCIGISMAELASAAPTSGGLYFWTHTLSSPRYKNVLAWVVGYANTIGLISGVASIDWGAAVQIMAAATIGSPGQSFTPTNGQTFAVYVAVVFSHALLCSLGTAFLARLQNVYVAVNIALCLAVIIAIPVATPKEFHNSASCALGNFTNLNGWPNGYAFILSFLSPVWTICSFDSSVHISEEATNAATAVPWAIVGSTAIGGILGTAIMVVLSFFMGTNINAIVNDPIGQPMAVILFNSLGQRGTIALWAFVVIAQYMMGSSTLLAASRQSFAFSRDGALPFSSYLYRMNSYTGTPVNTVWFTATCTALLGLLAFAGPAAIGAMFSGLPVAVISVSFMSFISVTFMFPSTPQTNASQMNYSVVVLGGVLLGSLLWYFFPKYGGVHWFKGPVPTLIIVDDDEEDKSSQERKELFQVEAAGV